MYQSISSETRTKLEQEPPRRRVEAIMGYDGPERRATPSTRPLTTITLAAVVSWVLRFWYLAVILAVLGALAGLAAGTLIKPRFTSYSDLLLDPSNLQVMADDLYARNVQSEAQLLDVESKMRVLSSTNVLSSVVRSLSLQNDPDLMEPGFSLLGNLFPADTTSEDRFTAAVRALGERVRVRREERSYVVTVSAWARSAEKSAQLTNALVEAFLAELASAETEGALSASAALNERLDQLRDDAAAAEAAVADYRRRHDLPMIRDDQLSTQSAVQLNTQVAAAREALITAEARYANLTAADGSGRINAAAQESEVLTGLRARHAEVRQQADSLAMTLGPRHPSLATAQSQVASLQREIDREVARVVQTAAADLERAQAVLERLTDAASEHMGVVFTDDEAQVELRQLERASASKVAIYEAHLTRAQQISERSQLSTSNVRVISAAVPPISRSFPPRTVILAAGGTFTGLALGIALACALGLLPRVRRALSTHA